MAGLFEFINPVISLGGGIIGGAWDSVYNVVNTIGKGAGSVVSNFFPTSQKTITTHLPIQSANTAGLTYRPTGPDAPSTFETIAMAAREWIDTPYEQQYAVPAKIQESQRLDTAVSSVKSSSMGDLLSDILSGAEKTVSFFETATTPITTLADRITSLGERLGLVKRREIVVETPRVGTPEGQDVSHLNQIQEAGANVLEMVKTAGSGILQQLKGLFNLAYDSPEGSQPVFTITHELQPSKSTTTGIMIVLVILVVLFLIFRKK